LLVLVLVLQKLLLLLQELQALEVLALLLELVLVEQLRPGAPRRPGLLEVRPPVILDLVVRPPRQAPRDRRPSTRVNPWLIPFPARLGAAHQCNTVGKNHELYGNLSAQPSTL
jgi:hypothetical protein